MTSAALRMGFQSGPQGTGEVARPVARGLVGEHGTTVEALPETGGDRGGFRNPPEVTEALVLADEYAVGAEHSPHVVDLPEDVLGRLRDVDEGHRGIRAECGHRGLPHPAVA